MLPKRFNALRELSHTVPPEQAKGLLRSARRAETGFAGGVKPALPAGRVQTMPWAIIASATLWKPAMFAPATRSFSRPYSFAAEAIWW